MNDVLIAKCARICILALTFPSSPPSLFYPPTSISIEATTMVIVLITVFGFGTFTITMLEKMKIPLGVPATDAVSLSENQSKILALESKYLVPFLTRPTEFSSHDNPASPNYRGRHGHGPGEAGREGEDGGPSAPDLSPGSFSRSVGSSLARGQTGESFIANDHIDNLFGYNNQSSMELSASGAGGAGGGEGLGRHGSQRNMV